MFTMSRVFGKYGTSDKDVDYALSQPRASTKTQTDDTVIKEEATLLGKTKIPNHKSISYGDDSRPSLSLQEIAKRNVLNEKKKKDDELPENINMDDKGKPDIDNKDTASTGENDNIGGGSSSEDTDTPNDENMGGDLSMDDDEGVGDENMGDDNPQDDGTIGPDGEPDNNAINDATKEEEAQEKFTKYHYFRMFDELRTNIELFNSKFLTYETSSELDELSKREVFLYIKERIEKIKNDISFILQYRIKTIDLDLLSKAYTNIKQQLIILFELFFNIFKDAKTKAVSAQMKTLKKEKKTRSKI